MNQLSKSDSLTRRTVWLVVGLGLLAGCDSRPSALDDDTAIEARREVVRDIGEAEKGPALLWHSPDLLDNQTAGPPLDSTLRRHDPYPE
ncbi:MAG TPA: hypothetical protein VHL52_11560 [Acidimicrobiia bacterium]|nr:hypothetical protein [Acidimicrobiia bacterium]